MDFGLVDRVYILTGASRGLGFATAQCLVADGARVVISARRQSAVDEAVTRLGPNAIGVAADLGDPATPDKLVNAARRRFNQIDGVLVSVGGPAAGRPVEVTDEQWQDAFATIFLGSVRMARTAATTLPAGGVIGFVLSSTVRSPVPNLAISNALRPALAGFAKDLADELAPLGIRVVGLLPHEIKTDRTTDFVDTASDAAQARADTEAAIPLRRIGDPEEFGRVAAFVLSPAASYLTGLAIPVDGGAVRAI
jgi:3-oxoacyl-[acyl-carrier protein] reductase